MSNYYEELYGDESEVPNSTSGFQFNDGQKTAINGLGQCLHTPGIYGLTGGAGRGKTTVFQEIIKNYISKNPRASIVVSAPTNKAVKVAYAMGQKANIAESIDYRTIHSLLGLMVDENEGQKLLKKSDRENNITDNDLIVVDEGSIVGRDLVDKLLTETRGEVPILVVMDKHQLPPVGEPCSSLFTKIETNYELTENMRQGDDSPCGVLVEDCMNAVIEGRYRYDPRHQPELIKRKGKETGTWLMSIPDWNKFIIPAFKVANRRGNWDDARVLAFYHNTIEQINEYIREHLYGEENALTSAYIPGEPLVCLSPVTRRVWDDFKQKMVKTIILPTASEVITYSAKESIDSTQINGIDYTYKIWNVCAQIPGTESTVWLKIPSPQVKKQWKADCVRLKEQAVEAKKQGLNGYWTFYYQLLEFFDDVRVAYGMTVYSCQGSTYKNIFCPGGDIVNIKNFDVRNRAWYVAMSRASEKIILC